MDTGSGVRKDNYWIIEAKCTNVASILYISSFSGSIAEIIGTDLARRNIKASELFKTYLQDSTEKMEITSSEDSTDHGARVNIQGSTALN